MSTDEAILAVRLPTEMRDALKAEADLHQRSMSGQVRWLIERSLTHDSGDATAGTASDRADRKAA